MECNTAVFYDIENLNGLFSTKNKQYLHLNEIYRRLLEVDGIKGIVIQRAYADWASLSHRNLRSSILQIGIEPVQVFNTNPNDKIKNASDVIMIIDVVEILIKRPEIENYVIASGDGIFAFLSKKLHEHGKRVIGCGFSQIVNTIFKNSCDYFIDLEFSDKSLISVIHGVKEVIEHPSQNTLIQTDQNNVVDANLNVSSIELQKQKTLRRALPKSFPKNSVTESLTKAELEPLKKLAEDWIVLYRIKEIVEIIFLNPQHDKLFLDISLLKNYINYFVPGFNTNRFRFRKFIDFIRFIFTNSQYCIVGPDGIYKATKRINALDNVKYSTDNFILEITTSDAQVLSSLFDLNKPIQFSFTYTHTNKYAKNVKAVISEQHENLTDESEIPDESIYFVRDEKELEITAEEIKPDKTIESDQTKIINISDSEKEESSIGIRRIVKQKMKDLFSNQLISLDEIQKLQTEKYSREKFGIRQPIIKEMNPQAETHTQRLVEGKAKYWVETFDAYGKKYYVYKNWLEGRNRRLFFTWLANLEK